MYLSDAKERSLRPDFYFVQFKKNFKAERVIVYSLWLPRPPRDLIKSCLCLSCKARIQRPDIEHRIIGYILETVKRGI